MRSHPMSQSEAAKCYKTAPNYELSPDNDFLAESLHSNTR